MTKQLDHPVVNGVHLHATGHDAYAWAKRMAKYGHRDWLVWRLPNGEYRTARLSLEATEQAMAECVENSAGKPVVVKIEQNCAVGHNVSRGLAAIWVRNMKAGCFAY